MATYIAIDLKSFYASVECVEHGFDPLSTNLVVADESRTEKTICLAVSPSLKAYGVSGRPRLFEVVQKVKEINGERLKKCGQFTGDSYFDDELKKDPSLALNYYVATPRMSYYMKYSSKIYSIYLHYASKEDIHVYSIDEVFIDVTSYLKTYGLSAHDLALVIVRDVLSQTGITATCGIGSNMYLCKVAMDIVAKHMPADEDGVRIAELDEMSYRKLLWNHEPLTDFWRVGPGISNKLIANGMHTMGDVARMSIENEELLYKLFGINAELLIDHAWGYEPCTIKEIKSYKPLSNSLSSGQVLKEPYSYDKGMLIVKEMSHLLALDMVDKGLVCDQVSLMVGYDVSSTRDYEGEIKADHYGRLMPKAAHGSENLDEFTSSSKMITDGLLRIYERTVDKKLMVRRINVIASRVIQESQMPSDDGDFQISLFENYEEKEKRDSLHKAELDKEKRMQKAMLKIQKKYGKNAVLKGNNLEEGATTIERNGQVGGHRA